MISDLKRYFSTTKDREMRDLLGVTISTLRRKAKSLGLRKDKEWLRKTNQELARIAFAFHKAKGYPGSFKKGVRYGRQFEIGNKESAETRAKRIASLKMYYMTHREETSQMARKRWETRRGRGTAFHKEETKKKISDSLKRYHQQLGFLRRKRKETSDE